MALSTRTVNVEAELHGAPPERRSHVTQPTTALARLEESARQPITSPLALTERIREWQQQAHVLTPILQISQIAPQHAVVPAIVLLDTRMDDQGVGVDVYRSKIFHKQGDECSLTKVALNKIASAGGGSCNTKRTDPRTIPLYWEMQAGLAYVDFDGTPRLVERTAEVDLREGSPQLVGMTPNQIAQARRFGLRLCEAKACNAAARDAWGIPSKFKISDLKKPFIALRVQFVPDMNDPEQRRMVTERALAGTAALYPSSRRLQAPDVIDVEPQRTEERQAQAEQQPEQQGRATSQPPTSEPPANVPRITEVREIKSGKRRDGTTWTLRAIVLSDAREGSTLDDKVAELAEQLCRDNAPVDVVIEEVKGNDGKTYKNVTSLERWQPGLYDQGDDTTPY